MGYFEDGYLKRLNRYGNNYAERVLTQRREVFRRRLDKSVYRIDFEFEGQSIAATFERFKQDHTEIFRYLFTQYDVIIPNGKVLFLPEPLGLEKDGDTTYPEYSGSRPNTDDVKGTELRPWLVYYLEDTNAKGYNRYILLKMTHFLKWKDRNKVDRTSYAYMYGQENNMLKDELKSRSRMDPLYAENLKSDFFIMPANEFLKKDDYFIISKDINNKPFDEYYRVTGYDIQTQDGIEYVTVDPIYEYAADFYDELEKPVLKEEDGETVEDKVAREELQKEIDKDYFWLQGQIKDKEVD